MITILTQQLPLHRL